MGILGAFGLWDAAGAEQALGLVACTQRIRESNHHGQMQRRILIMLQQEGSYPPCPSPCSYRSCCASNCICVIIHKSWKPAVCAVEQAPGRAEIRTIRTGQPFMHPPASHPPLSRLCTEILAEFIGSECSATNRAAGKVGRSITHPWESTCEQALSMSVGLLKRTGYPDIMVKS